MKLSNLSAAATILSQASLVLGRAVDSHEDTLEVARANATEWEGLTDLFDSLSWLDDDGAAASATLLASGDKVPAQNFLSLCDGDHSGDAVTIGQVDLDPAMPVKGQKLSVAGSGTIKNAVVAGTTVGVKIKMNSLTVLNKKYDLCKELEKIGGGCPLNPGKPKLQKAFTIPKAVPKASYSIVVNVLGPDKSPITCVEGKFKVT